MVSISPFVNKMFYSRLFTASLVRQEARGQLSGGVSWVVGHCIVRRCDIILDERKLNETPSYSPWAL